MDEIRQRKLEDQIREELASLIIGGEVKDPRVGPFVSLTRVEAARDLSFARVFVSSFAAVGGSMPLPADASAPQATEQRPEVSSEDEALDRAVAGLNNAAGFMQARIGKRLRTRLTPKLLFVADRGIRAGFEMNERIKGLFP